MPVVIKNFRRKIVISGSEPFTAQERVEIERAKTETLAKGYRLTHHACTPLNGFFCVYYQYNTESKNKETL